MNYRPVGKLHLLSVLLLLLLPGSVALAAGPLAGVRASRSDLETVRRRVTAELLAPAVDDGRVASLVRTIQADGRWPNIDYRDVSRTGFEHRLHVDNLVEMSRAYRKPGSRWYGRPELKQAISSALDFWIRNDFIAENWHSNEIGNPSQWTSVLLLMDSELSERHARALVRMAGRANLHAWGARPGGDLIKIAGIMAERALFERDEDALEVAVRAMAAEINFTTGNGLKPDFSFNHRTDRVTSILSYGTGYADAFAAWARRLEGTRYRFPDKALELVIDFFLEGISRTLVHGRYPDPGAINREMTRRSTLGPIGPELPVSLLQASRYRRDELENIVQIRMGKKRPDLSGNRFFWHTEYMSHQRPDYFTSVRMYSARNHNMEFPHNSEGLKHHHFADGSNFISLAGDEYRDIFPVWDWQKIPGTTVVQKPSLPGMEDIVKQGRTDFVGAVSDGTYGAAAFDFQSPHDPLAARKAWFFFDKEFVALGAGIRSDSEHPVATTLNQSLSRGDVVVRTNTGQSVVPKGEHDLTWVSWIYHDGIAYLFRRPTDVRLGNRVRRGAWREITRQGWARALDEDARQEVFTLWLDHGRRPRQETYEYIVVPGIEPANVERYRRTSGIRVLANTAQLQGVAHDGLGLTQIVFYQPAGIVIADGSKLAVDQPGLVMVEASHGVIERLSVSDPTRKLRSFRLRASARVEGAGRNWSAAWNEPGKYSEIDVELPGGAHAGRTVVLDLGRSGPAGSPSGLAASGSVRPPHMATPGRNGAGEGRTVGERYGGGVVFWVDETGTSGLVAATGDQSPGTPWSRGAASNTHTHATGDGSGAGERNTLLIVDGHTDRDPADFAAKLCVDHRGGGFRDWYLPSKAELDRMYRLRDEIGGFANAMYWSSTEYNVGFAWVQYFYGYGGQYTSPKGGTSRVRCVRRF